MLSTVLYSQTAKNNFAAIDRSVLSIDDTSPSALALKLTSPYSTELEKVRSIFRWITEHVQYKVYDPVRRDSKRYNVYEEPDDDLPHIKPLNERVSLLVLKRRTAICDQYSRLFKTLCDYAGLCSEIITGYAKPNFRSEKKFASNHSWNAVWIEDKWHLLDVTWASGVISFSGNEFIKQFDEYYFLTPPHLFIRDHYPEEIKWTLMDNPPVLKEFSGSPFKCTGYVKSGILSVFPGKGIIEANPGDRISIELETKNPFDEFSLTETYSKEATNEKNITFFQSSHNKITAEYIIPAEKKDWLYVVWNGEPVLRYKINVRISGDNFWGSVDKRKDY